MRRNIELRKLCDKTRVTAGIQINYNLKLVCLLTRSEQELAGVLSLSCTLKTNRSECDHLLQFPAKGGKGTVINRRRPIAMKDKVCDVLRAQR